MKIVKPITALLPILFASSCIFSQANPVLNYLPSDAQMIMKTNLVSIGLKINWGELSKYKMFNDGMKGMPEKGKEYLSNPARTGLDLFQGLYLVSRNMDGKEQESLLYAIPKDTAQFAAMMKDLHPRLKVTKTGNGNILVDSNTVVGWNNEIIVFIRQPSKKDTVGLNPKAKASAYLERKKELTEECKLLLTKRPAPFNNPQAVSLLNEQGDMLLWTDNAAQAQQQFQKKAKIPPFLGMLNSNLKRKGNATSAIINFENGKMVVHMKQYIPDSMVANYEKNPAKNINTELIKKLPNAHPIFLFSFNISPQMIMENLAKSAGNAIVDSFGKQKEKIEDILSSIKGDITLAVLKTEIADDDSTTKAMGGIEVFLTGGINNQEKFESLNALLQEKQKDSTKANPSKKPKPKPAILSNDSIFVVSLSPVAAQNFMSSPGNNEDMEKIVEPYKNNPFAMVIELRTIFGFILQSASKNKSEEETKQAADIFGMFDKLVSYGGHYENHSVSSNFELILSDKNENSLKQFINLMNLFYSMKAKKSVAYN
ncbi:MAG TPA: DUF4836 family protein [Chitinophagaceae bacterium]|jgi:hypothetical protein